MHNKQNNCYICKKGFSTDDNNKKYHKARDHCHLLENTEGLLTVVYDIKHQKKFL